MAVGAAERRKLADMIGRSQADNLVTQLDQTFVDNESMTFGTGSDATITYDGTNLLYNSQVVGSGVHAFTGPLTVGEDDTGYDVTLYGAAAGAFCLYDESENTLIVRGATAAGPGILNLSTGELTNVDGGILGRIDFQAPLDAGGTDAILLAASIWAEADDTFAADNNTTDLVFATAASEAATAKMRLTSDGSLGIATDAPTAPLHVDQAAAAGAKPVARLDQGDGDESFIDFVGTSAADSTASLSSSAATAGTKNGAIRVEVNGVHVWIRTYDSAV
jgi:hypothetical protein